VNGGFGERRQFAGHHHRVDAATVVPPDRCGERIFDRECTLCRDATFDIVLDPNGRCLP
jgi:hypothetical protein